jgi:hypothetical protein
VVMVCLPSAILSRPIFINNRLPSRLCSSACPAAASARSPPPRFTAAGAEGRSSSSEAQLTRRHLECSSSSLAQPTWRRRLHFTRGGRPASNAIATARRAPLAPLAEARRPLRPSTRVLSSFCSSTSRAQGRSGVGYGSPARSPASSTSSP